MSLKKYFTKGANSQNEAGEGASSQIEDYVSESSEDEVEGGPSSSKKVCIEPPTKQSYKKNMKFNPEWENKWGWMTYDKYERGMICTVCKKYGKPPVQAHSAWVTRAINNWQKATDLRNMKSQSGTSQLWRPIFWLNWLSSQVM